MAMFHHGKPSGGSSLVQSLGLLQAWEIIIGEQVMRYMIISFCLKGLFGCKVALL